MPENAGRFLGIVPARGGSKGIPRKNLADLCGRPLIAWSLQTGKDLVHAGALERCIVSTDDREIAEVCRGLGADVPYLRPSVFASDDSPAIDYVLHALDTLDPDGQEFDGVVLLQPTSPLRNVDAIAGALDEFTHSSRDSLISCYRDDYVNDLVMYSLRSDGSLRPRRGDHASGVRRQEHGPVWIRNGALYATRSTFLREEKRLICESPLALEMPKSESIDVDTQDDLDLLRRLLCR